MVTVDRPVASSADIERLDYLNKELKAIEDEIDGELEAHRQGKPMRPDFATYSAKRRERINLLVAEAKELMDKYQ